MVECERCGDVISEEDQEDIDFDGEHCRICQQFIWEEENLPNDDDITTEDHIRFYQYGKEVVYVDKDAEDWRPAVQAYMDKHQFWVGVWFISDHGNAILLDMSAQ